MGIDYKSIMEKKGYKPMEKPTPEEGSVFTEIQSYNHPERGDIVIFSEVDQDKVDQDKDTPFALLVEWLGPEGEFKCRFDADGKPLEEDEGAQIIYNKLLSQQANSD
ncbi:MAG: hypothetical protein U9Q92_02880 [archaeon]|nr:hypothetical protein [archaeon]